MTFTADPQAKHHQEMQRKRRLAEHEDAHAASGAMSDINITPLIDVMLVLLIIFMIASPLIQKGVEVNVPKTAPVQTAAELGGSEWAAVVHGLEGGRAPAADLGRAADLHRLVRALVAGREDDGVHDCADGGLAVTLVEMAVAGACGFRVAPPAGVPLAGACFAESASRVVLVVDPQRVEAVVAAALAAGVPVADLGEAGGERCVMEGAFDVALGDATAAWSDALPSALAPR